MILGIWRKHKMDLDNIFQIQVNPPEDNLDKGFAVLRKTGLEFICLSDEKYIVSVKHLDSLDAAKVDYKLLRLWYGQCQE
jgi:hypothetical protein